MTKLFAIRRVLILLAASLVFAVAAPSQGRATGGEWQDLSTSNYCGGGPCAGQEQACIAVSAAWWSDPKPKLLSCTMISQTRARATVVGLCCGDTNFGEPSLICPADARPDTDGSTDGCTRVKQVPVICEDEPSGEDQPSCNETAGNPISLVEGNKEETVVDFTTGGANPLRFVRYYNSDNRAQTAIFAMPLGRRWQSNFDRYLRAPNANTRVLYRPGGTTITFVLSGSTWVPPGSMPFQLAEVGGNWEFTDLRDTVEVYDSDFRLVSITRRNGYQQTLAYDVEGTLETVTDSYGRALTFGFTGKRLTSLTAADGSTYGYVYDHPSGEPYMPLDRLVEVIHPHDGVPGQEPRTTYHYEDPSLPGYLTGITDERGVRYATWAYDVDGRAISSQHAGGADATSIVYHPDGSRTVTGSLGQQTIYRFTEIAGMKRLTSIERQANGNVPAATETRVYGPDGFIDSRTDFKGNVTSYIHDSRGLQTSRTQAAGTPEERTITTTWHPTFRVPDVVTEPGRTTDYDYDAQGRVASVTVTDTTNHTVPYSTNGETRTWTYTYNSSGQVLTVDGPRTDVIDVTTFEYDALGNREKVINAMGHTTHITAYNARGLPLTILDPNGIVTELDYNPRGWLVERRVKDASGDSVTSFDYNDVGQMITITLPNGVQLFYEYDDARRLKAVRNNLNERIDYSLDAMGNRTAATVKSLTGSIERTQTRVFDELGRLLQNIGASNQTWSYVYDDNGNLKTITDPATGPTQRAVDALDRLIQITDPALETVGYKYDELDNLTEETDQRSLTTTYTHNAFGDLIQLDSPDTGITVYIVDPAGNATQATDARGVVTNMTYDALDRVLTRDYPADAAQNVTFAYDDTTGGHPGKGRLTSVTDQSGSTAFRYDHRGNLREETRVIDGNSFTTRYGFDLADNPTEITYPSGRIVNYIHDSLGRVTSVTTRESPTAIPVTVAGGISYLPFGPMEAFTYGNGMTVTFDYDQDYRLRDIDTTDSITTAQDLTIVYDDRNNITAITDNLDTARDQSFGYDTLSRLTSATGAYGSIAYTYDAIGNRKTRDVTVNTVTTNEVYTYAIDSNRLETVDVGGTLRTVTHGLSGNITADDRGAGPDVSFDYDQHDRLIQVQQGALPLKQYVYNAGGERVIKQAPGGFDPEYFHYDQAGRLLAESDGTGAYPRSYIFLNGMIIAQVEPGSGGGTPIDVILDDGAAGTTPSGTWDASTAGVGYEGSGHQVRPAPPEGVEGGLLIDNGDAGFNTVGNCSSSTADPGFEGSDYLACDPGSGGSFVEQVDLPLVNPDAETGDLTGWTNEAGAFAVSTPASSDPFFFAGNVKVSRMYQDVAVPTAQHAAVDAGGWSARIVWQQDSYNGSDNGSVILVFLDGGGQQIGPKFDSNRRAPLDWTAREFEAEVPPLTRTVRLKLRGFRTNGTQNSAYFDDLILSLVRKDESLTRQPLTVVNGDAETNDTSGWTLETGDFKIRNSNDPAPVQGVHYFTGGAAANTTAYQDLVLPAAQLAAVDAGDRSLQVTWRQSSWAKKDKAGVVLEFLDGVGTATGAAVESDLIGARKWWEDRELTAAIPPNTRTVRLKLTGQRVAGTNLDSYFDQVTADLILSASPPSIPANAASWSFQVPSSEDFEIYARWPDGASFATDASYSVLHAGGVTTVTKSQRQGGGKWDLLGSFSFEAGVDYRVELADQGSGPLAADGLYIVPASRPYASYTWAPTLPSAGEYQVYAKWVANAGRASDAVYGVYHSGGLAEVTVHQQSGGGLWQPLGSYSFDPANNPIVVLAGGSDGTLSADAIRFVGSGPVPADLRFVHNDHLGTPQKLTDNTGTVIWDRIQTPFGLDHSIIGSAATPVRFPGQYLDGESSNYYNYFRDYDPGLGRYVQSDPIGLKGGLNTYSYVYNRPVTHIDPDGEFGFVGCAIGAAMDFGMQMAANGWRLRCVNYTQMLTSCAAGFFGGVFGSLGRAATAGAFKHSISGLSWLRSSKTWNAVSKRYRNYHNRKGTAPRGNWEAHHWYFARRGRPDNKSWWGNHPLNLNPLPREIHRRMTGSWQGQNRFNPLQRWWYGTPGWYKQGQAIGGMTGGLIANAMGSNCDCDD